MNVLLLSGSRSLSRTPSAIAWARRAISRALLARPATQLVAGDAYGPDHWARLSASDFALRWDRYCLDGSIEHAADAPTRWHDGPALNDRGWPLRRNDAMVAAAQAMVARGDSVRCLALRTPWSRTQGTLYTANAARAAGIDTTELICPQEYAVHGAPLRDERWAVWTLGPAGLVGIGRACWQIHQEFAQKILETGGFDEVPAVVARGAEIACLNPRVGLVERLRFERLLRELHAQRGAA